MMRTVLIIGCAINAVEERDFLDKVAQRLQDEAAECVFELSPVMATDDCADCVVLNKEVRHVASESPLPRREPRRPAFWLGSDRRWG